MKIVQCSKCGRYIHETTKCFHCGNTVDFIKISNIAVHENVAQEFKRMERLIGDKRFDEAIDLSYRVIEWMPNFASIFWLRLLAKNKCSSAIELLSIGFSCDVDPDFCNALRFSVGEEHAAYEDIQKIIYKIRKLLESRIVEHECMCKYDTNIMQIKSSIQKEIDGRKQKLFLLWSDLDDTERSLYELEVNCRLLMKEHRTSLLKASQDASAIRSSTYYIDECTADKLHAMQIQMGKTLQQSETSKSSIESMKYQHPWVKAFNDLVTQRNKQVKLINAEIESLVSYEQTVQKTISAIKHIESFHKAALNAAEKYNFTYAAALLGIEAYNQILCSAGVVIGSSINMFSEKLKQLQEAGSTNNSNTGDDIGVEDYYATWGQNED